MCMGFVGVCSEAAEMNLFSSDFELGKDLSLSLSTFHLQVCGALIIKSTAF